MGPACQQFVLGNSEIFLGVLPNSGLWIKNRGPGLNPSHSPQPSGWGSAALTSIANHFNGFLTAPIPKAYRLHTTRG